MKSTFNAIRVHRDLDESKKTHATVTSSSKMQRIALMVEIAQN